MSQSDPANRCPVCLFGPNALFSNRQWPLPFGERSFAVYECRHCHGYYTWPRPTALELARVYGEFYDYTWFQKHEFFKKIQAWHRWRRLKNLLKPFYTRPARRFLDVGCGHGHFLIHAKQDGWETLGADFASPATEFARTHYGLKVAQGAFQELAGADPLNNGSFDLITIWHCLEHTVDPVKFLASAARLVKPDGLIVVAVPNSGCSAFRRLRENWTWYQEPWVHTVHMNGPAMRAAADRAGLNVVSITSRDTWDANWLCDEFLYPEYHILSRAARALGASGQFLAENSARILLYGVGAMKYWALGIESTSHSGAELLAVLRLR
jgi:2-polyprenyl-3-methyl-5-hydroxy-6-metoxy-1,4-benzoquinol methylase